MALERILYVVFALLSVVGIWLIADHFGSRRLAVVLSLATALFFVALALALRWLVLTYAP